MDQIFHEIKINTKGQGLYDFTNETVSWLNKQKINNGILNINILHNSRGELVGRDSWHKNRAAFIENTKLPLRIFE